MAGETPQYEIDLALALGRMREARKTLPDKLAYGEVGPLLNVLTDLNEQMKDLLTSVRTSMGIPAGLVDEDGLPESEHARALVEMRAQPHGHDHRCSDECAASEEHLKAMDEDADRQVEEAERD